MRFTRARLANQIFVGNFIYNNYRQALEIISTSKANLRLLEERLGTSSDDYQRYLMEERRYLASLKQEPEDTLQKVEYMEKLEKLKEAE